MVELDIKALELDLKIAKQDDWYKISQMQIDEFGGATALRRYGGLEKVPNMGEKKTLIIIRRSKKYTQIINGILKNWNQSGKRAISGG